MTTQGPRRVHVEISQDGAVREQIDPSQRPPNTFDSFYSHTTEQSTQDTTTTFYSAREDPQTQAQQHLSSQIQQQDDDIFFTAPEEPQEYEQFEEESRDEQIARWAAQQSFEYTDEDRARCKRNAQRKQENKRRYWERVKAGEVPGAYPPDTVMQSPRSACIQAAGKARLNAEAQKAAAKAQADQGNGSDKSECAFSDVSAPSASDITADGWEETERDILMNKEYLLNPGGYQQIPSVLSEPTKPLKPWQKFMVGQKISLN